MGAMSKDMVNVSEYLQTSKPKINTTKTVLAVLHLNNKEATLELNVSHNNETLLFYSEPTYLGVTSDRLLTNRRYLVSLGNKLTSGVALLRRLADSGLECWTNSVANSHLDPDPLKNKVLPSYPQCSTG